MVLLYRDIESVGRLSLIMLVMVFITVGWVIVAGLSQFSWTQAFDFPPEALRLDKDLIFSLGLWLTIFVTGPWEGIVFSVLFLLASVVAYFAFEKMQGRVPLGD